MATLIDEADRVAVSLYERSRENGSHHELALRIATAAWRASHPQAADKAYARVRAAVRATCDTQE